MKIFFLAIVLLISPVNLLFAQTTNSKKKKFYLNETGEKAVGYAQAVKKGNTIYISGTVGQGDMASQVKEIYERIGKTLAGYGANWGNVVKENVFATDLELFKKHAAIRKEYYQEDWPAATWVEVRRLYLPEFLVEIEVVAEL